MKLENGNEMIKLTDTKKFGSKAFLKNVEVGKWFKFNCLSVGQEMIGYGKVIAILENGYVEVEKYFELPSYRPYAARTWFDNLPFAI